MSLHEEIIFASIAQQRQIKISLHTRARRRLEMSCAAHSSRAINKASVYSDRHGQAGLF
jgi:hypothetical protein